MNDEAEIRKRILYGRRRGKKLRGGRQVLVEQLLPHLSIEVPDTGKLDQAEVFAGMPDVMDAELWLEIGFGGGEHLAAQAGAHPDIAIIGCEPFINGVASLLSHIERDGLQNVRIWNEDARELIAALPDASLSKVYLLYPDPWPKARHARRRFVSPENLDEVARVLKDDGEFRLATDHPVYCRWALARTVRHADFDWTANSAVDWKEPPANWPGTRYEAKAIREGRTPHYLNFVRQARIIA